THTIQPRSIFCSASSLVSAISSALFICVETKSPLAIDLPFDVNVFISLLALEIDFNALSI
ncbi:hypothetical protein, partial [Pseudothermotoga elfii]